MRSARTGSGRHWRLRLSDLREGVHRSGGDVEAVRSPAVECFDRSECNRDTRGPNQPTRRHVRPESGAGWPAHVHVRRVGVLEVDGVQLEHPASELHGQTLVMPENHILLLEDLHATRDLAPDREDLDSIPCRWVFDELYEGSRDAGRVRLRIIGVASERGEARL